MPVVATDSYQFDPPNPQLMQPAVRGVALTKSDSDELAEVSRGIWVGVAGDIAVKFKGSTTAVVFTVPAGSILPFRIRQLMSTNTTATQVVALY